MPGLPRLAGQVLVEQLLALGADTVFCAPGESSPGVLDGLFGHRTSLRVVTSRQEGGTAMMAAAYGQLTGRPGIALVTRGPGASSAAVGVHLAEQDAIPLLLFIGQVPLRSLDRRSFQEIDYRRMFNGTAKEVLEIRAPHRLPEYVARAWRTAVAGEPGPVVVVLPEDMLRRETAAPVVPPTPRFAALPGPEAVPAVVEALASAERPLVVVGGVGWAGEGVARLDELVAAEELPFATAFRRQDLIDNTAPAYVGGFGPLSTAGLAESARQADVVLLLGTRPDEQTAARWLDEAVPTARVLHVHPDPGVIGKLLPVEVAVVAEPEAFVRAWLEAYPQGIPAGHPDWTVWRTGLRANYERVRAGTDGPATAYMQVLNRLLPADAVLSVGAGAYTAWAQRHHDYTRYGSCLGSASGARGYGLPSAITAKLLHPHREVVALAGDGCFLTTGQELATAVQEKLAVTVLVINDHADGVVRDHRQRDIPDRPVATTPHTPDFAAVARAYGAHGVSVSTPADLRTVWLGRPGDRPSLIEIRIPSGA